MSDPMPLTAPDGTVYAYACGRCRRVKGGSEYASRVYSDDEVAQMANHSRNDAERCCTCRGCGASIDEPYGMCAPCKAADEERRRVREAQIKAEDEAYERLREQSLEAASDRRAATALERLMSDISEDHYCATWLCGLDAALWHYVVNGPGQFGMGMITEADIEQLKALADGAGGWWHWPDGAHGTLFVPMAEWLEMYGKDRTDG